MWAKRYTTMIKSSQDLTCTTSIPLTGLAADGNTPPPPSSLNKDAISHCQEKTGKQKQEAVKDRAKRLGVITAR